MLRRSPPQPDDPNPSRRTSRPPPARGSRSTSSSSSWLHRLCRSSRAISHRTVGPDQVAGRDGGAVDAVGRARVGDRRTMDRRVQGTSQRRLLSMGRAAGSGADDAGDDVAPRERSRFAPSRPIAECLSRATPFVRRQGPLRASARSSRSGSRSDLRPSPDAGSGRGGVHSAKRRRSVASRSGRTTSKNAGDLGAWRGWLPGRGPGGFIGGARYALGGACPARVL